MYRLPLYALLCALYTTAWISALVHAVFPVVGPPCGLFGATALSLDVFDCVLGGFHCVLGGYLSLLGGVQAVCLCGGALAPLAFLLCCSVRVLFVCCSFMPLCLVQCDVVISLCG